MEVTDEQLVRGCCQGHGGSFQALVDRHYDWCLRYAWRALGSRHDAEEAVQDAFLRAYRSLSRSDPSRFRAWLGKILVNRVRWYGGRLRRYRRLVEGFRVRSMAEAEPGLPEDPERIDQTPVGLALRQLSPLLREAVLLRHVEEMTYEEIAAATGATVSAAKMRVKRGTDRLAQVLGEAADD